MGQFVPDDDLPDEGGAVVQARQSSRFVPEDDLPEEAPSRGKTFAGSVNPSSHGEDRWEGSLTTVLEFNSTAAGYVTAMLSGAVQRRIQLTATNTTPSRIAVIQFAGTLVEGVKLFEDRDGNITVSLKWNGTYSSTLGNWLKAKITNELATLR